jgi:hypothetical protein
MHFRGKALINLLRNNWLQDQTISIEPWQVEDYRLFSLEEIFERLKELHIALNEESFLLYAENCEAPEELLDYIWMKEEATEKERDQAYLLLFELWRRLLPEKRTLSIFCDELDERIGRYDLAPAENEESIQEILTQLEDILDESVDLGADPKEVFLSIEEFSAHDVENFLYDYIVHQIEQGDATYASELLDGFYAYVTDPRWFDFLRARLFALADPHEANLIIAGLLEILEEAPDFDLLFEIATYLSHAGNPSLFLHAVRQASHLIETEEDLQDLSTLLLKFFQGMEQIEKEKAVQNFLTKRKSRSHGKDDFHADVEQFSKLLNEFSETLLEDA